MDAVKKDMQVVGVRVEDTVNRSKWKPLKRKKLYEEEEFTVNTTY